MRIRIIAIVFICLIRFNTVGAIFEWLFGGKNDEMQTRGKTIRTSALKFEVPTADNKFLQLKDALDNLSPLDECYHIVVYSLKTRCGELTEEEFGKLSVQLLNCQSSAEERKTYTCTQTMSLAECTKEMDPTTWNSYQIVSNRARALCHSVQQQQFRKLTELTVNQLLTSAHGQLDYLKQIQDGQDQLHDMTTDTIRKLYESQSDLMGNQALLRAAQDDVLEQIHTNMVDLKQEKAMIASGNKELADLTENIKNKLDATTAQLLQQEANQQESHKKITSDLTYIQTKAHDALTKLDDSSESLMQNHAEMLEHYRAMYDNMLRINTTVTRLLTTLTYMQSHLDERINWFTHLLNVADDKLSMITCGALHISYFLFAALAVSFLQTPPFTRVLLFVLVTLNVSMEIQCGHSLDFVSISLIMFVVCLVNWFYNRWRKKQRKNRHKNQEPVAMIGSSRQTGTQQTDSDNEERNQTPDTTTAGSPLSPIELRQLNTTLNRLCQSLNESNHSGADNPSVTGSVPRRGDNLWSDGQQPSTSAFTPVIRPQIARPDSTSVHNNISKVRKYLLENLEETSSVGDMSEANQSTSTRHRPSSRGSTSTNRSLCQGLTKTGTPCRLTCSRGSEFCYRHKAQPPP